MKRYTFKNIQRFLADLCSCVRLMRKPYMAYGYLRAGMEPLIGRFVFCDIPFVGRKEDWAAIREVLVEDEYSCVDSLLPADGEQRVLDLGANIGTFAMRMFSHNSESRIVSVEAAEDTFNILDENKKLNPTLNWEVMKNGVWREDGPLTLMRRGISVGHRVIEGQGDEVIMGVSLQTLIENLGWESIDLIKMDIEGGEEAVIPSALEILRKTRFLIVELHSDRVDIAPLIKSLREIYARHWQLNARESSKPLFVMTNENIDLSGYVRA
jgi:FkbM family methyltransferase